MIRIFVISTREPPKLCCCPLKGPIFAVPSLPNPARLLSYIDIPVVSLACLHTSLSSVPCPDPSSVPYLGYCRASLPSDAPYSQPHPFYLHVTVCQEAALGLFLFCVLVLFFFLTAWQGETKSAEIAKEKITRTFVDFTKTSYLSSDGKSECLTRIIN